MAKITRATQKQFGLNGASGDFGQFGSLAAGAPNYTKNPAIIQSLAAFLTGWSAETIASNRPALEDFNGLDYLAFYQICYLFQAGIAEWDSDTTYYTNSFCQVSGVIYKSLQDDNLNQNPTTQTAYWQNNNVAVLKACYPVGSIYSNKTVSTNPATLLGFGTWTAIEGVVVVGYKSGDANFGTPGASVGVVEVTLSAAQSGVPAHTHGMGGGFGRYDGDSGGGLSNKVAVTNTTANSTAAASSPHTNIQPSVVCYVWERTA